MAMNICKTGSGKYEPLSIATKKKAGLTFIKYF